MEIVYRKGRKADALPMAEMIRLAAGGVVEYLFHGLVPGATPVEAVARGLEADHGPYSYKNAVVAEHSGTVVGVALAYPSLHHRVTQGMMDFFPRDRIDHLRPFYEARVEDSLYLDSLAVAQAFRRRGIGSALIHRTKQKAQEMDFRLLSLMVFLDNHGALRLYEETGFERVRNVDLAPNEFIPHQGGCLLLRCSVDASVSYGG